MSLRRPSLGVFLGGLLAVLFLIIWLGELLWASTPAATASADGHRRSGAPAGPAAQS